MIVELTKKHTKRERKLGKRHVERFGEKDRKGMKKGKNTERDREREEGWAQTSSKDGPILVFF